MDKKLAVVSIIVSDLNAVESVNCILHDYAEFIIGRMGIPYREKSVFVINVVIDAPQDKISGLSGKLGMVKGVQSKVLTTK